MPVVDEIVGFDLGHGETAIARVSLQPNSTPTTLEIMGRKSQVTAIGQIPGNGLVIGENALSDLRVKDLRLGFKERPPSTPDATRALVEFVRQCKNLLKGQIRDGGRTHYFVGCPSAWTNEEVSAYQALLEPVLSPLRVVRESRAALIQARDDGRISPESLRSSIIVIDIGSLTTDVSFVFGGIQDESFDIGMDLGGHHIDKEILRRSIEQSPDRESIEQYFHEEPGARRLSEALCRRFKEHYWSNENVYHSQGYLNFVPLSGRANLYLKVFLNGEEMETILTTPLPELKGESWKRAFVQLLERIKRDLSARERVPRILLLTGGPSRMSFIPAICDAMFPEAELTLCTPFEEAVALGLARWGSIHLRTDSFSDEVRSLCANQVPKIVSRYADDLRDKISSAIAQGLVIDVIGATTREWRSGQIRSLNDMDKQIIERTRAWLESEHGLAVIDKAQDLTLQSIKMEINSLTGDICRRHDVPHSSLLLSMKVPLKENNLISTEKPFDGVLGVAAMISFAVLFVLTGAAKVALAGGGPSGWLVLGLLSAWTAFFGLSTLDDKLKEANLPVAVRRSFLSEEKLAKLLGDAAQKVQEKIKEGLGPIEMERVTSELAKQLSEQLNAKAEEVRWIIS